MRTVSSSNLRRGVLPVLAAVVLSGCAGKPRSHVHYFEPQPENTGMQNGRIATLGAGDALGVHIRRNDIYLAYLRESGQPLLLTGVAGDQ